jgi:hypothetical protein
VFKDRASTNRAVDEKEKTIKQLRQALPDAPDGIIGGEEELEAQLAEIDARKDHDLGEVHTKLSAFAQTISVQVASDEKTFDEQIEALQKQIESLRTHKADALAGYRLRVTNVEAKANVKRQEIKDAHRATREPVETQLAVLRTNRNAAAKREQTIETIRMLEGELGDLNQDVARQNKALEDIKQYKSDMLNNLPIPGVEVRNSEIYRHNIVFDRLNTAQRVDMAVELAKLRAGELGVVCVDGIEAMDSATFNEFRQRSQDSKLQFFVSHVTDGPFGIKTDDPF